MARKPDIPCVPNPDCKYFNSDRGCYEDRHHIYKKSEATTQLMKRFCNMADHVIDICREKHEAWENELGWPEYPSVEEMRVVVSPPSTV